jgi:death-on-curing protein
MNSTSANAVRYLTASDLYAINDRVTGAAFVRDLHLLNSAALRPTLVLFGQPQFPTLIDKAACYLHSLAYHHLFADGNKRTAAEAVALFLKRNGHEVTWDAFTAQAFILEVAQGVLDVERVAVGLAAHVRPVER